MLRKGEGIMGATTSLYSAWALHFSRAGWVVVGLTMLWLTAALAVGILQHLYLDLCGFHQEWQWRHLRKPGAQDAGRPWRQASDCPR